MYAVLHSCGIGPNHRMQYYPHAVLNRTAKPNRRTCVCSILHAVLGRTAEPNRKTEPQNMCMQYSSCGIGENRRTEPQNMCMQYSILYALLIRTRGTVYAVFNPLCIIDPNQRTAHEGFIGLISAYYDPWLHHLGSSWSIRPNIESLMKDS